MESNPDVMDETVRGDDESLVDPGAGFSAADGEPRQDPVVRPHLVAGDVVFRSGDGSDDPVLRTAGKAAAQMVSGESVLDALLHPGAVRGEGNRVAVVADQCVDIGLRGGDALGFR